MDEVMRAEPAIGSRQISARTAAAILFILLVFVLAGNPGLQNMVEDFLNAPIIPWTETAGNDAEAGKKEEKLAKVEKIGVTDKKNLTLKDTVVQEEAVSDKLLSSAALPDPSLELPYTSVTAEEYLTKEPLESIPEVSGGAVWNQNTVEKVVVTPSVSEKVLDDSGEADSIYQEKPSGHPVIAEPVIPVEKPEADGKDDTVNVEVTVPKEDTVVSGEEKEELIPPEAILPDPSNPDAVIPEIPADDPAKPEDAVTDPIVPDPGIDDSDVTDDIPSDMGEDMDGTDGNDSCFLLDEAGMLYGFQPEYAEIPDGCLTLPAGCTGIRSGAFLGCGAVILELYIPAGTAVIEEGALAGLNFLEWIEVESGNTGFTSDSGVLFDITMSVLMAFPAAWMDGYCLPPSVTRIAGRAFEGTSISRLDVRECGILSFGDHVFGSSGGSGIQIVVSESASQVYEELLVGYEVTITR